MVGQAEIINVTSNEFIPVVTVGNGFITTNGKYFSTTEAFELERSDYVADASQSESRKVLSISRDGLSGILEGDGFTVNLSSLGLFVIKKEDTKIISMGIAADVGSETRVDGSVIESGSSVNNVIPPNHADAGYGYVRPVFIDGLLFGPCTVTIQKFRNN